ncbi:hypothetical protein MFLAVUS_007152 [Mucor flavus]|uniref:Uncharacterized protein n=1 Tax=Mucor flavus TaxID=439312 RepID=A0ABP9Z3I1_9FUNG
MLSNCYVDSAWSITSSSRLCPNHEYTIKERLQMAFPISYQSYTVSLTFKSFIKQDEGDPNKLLRYQERIIAQSLFLREAVYKAQLLVNYYISNSANNNVEYLSNDIFEKNFLYRVCRLIYGNINIEELQNFYPRLPGIQAVYNRLQALGNVNLSVEKQGLIVYGQIVSSACDTIATAYNNFYVENYETAPKLQAFLNNIIQPVRNRVHRLPLSREEVTKNPFVVLSVMSYTRQFYELINIQLQENTQPAPIDQSTEQPPEQPPAQTGELVDGQKLSTLFPDTRLQKEENEANFAFSTRCFFNSFDFTKLKIRSLVELQELPGQKGRIFLNSVYTDGYTRRISFTRRVPKVLDEDKVNLEMADFNTDEVETFFRPCFLDPGRKNAYVAYFGDEQVRSLTVNE